MFIIIFQLVSNIIYLKVWFPGSSPQLSFPPVAGLCRRGQAYPWLDFDLLPTFWPWFADGGLIYTHVLLKHLMFPL